MAPPTTAVSSLLALLMVATAAAAAIIPIPSLPELPPLPHVPVSPPPRPHAPEPVSPPPKPHAPEPVSPPPKPLAPAPAPAQHQPGVIIINGTVPCTPVPPTSGLQTPVFPNATVLLRCGTQQIANTTTDVNGKFEILLHIDGAGLTLQLLLHKCKLVIPTPLSVCNASLPTTGILKSSLKVFVVGRDIIITVVKFVWISITL